jgi:YegS/Rv2252/BmrU family lipid kinase
MRDHPDAASAFRENPAIVFVNSAAGGGRARVCLPRIQEVFKSLRIQAQFVMTNSASELESCAQAAISQGKQLLLAMGGDGTFQSLANAASGAEVVLGILPIGGGNDFASALGLPSEPTEAAEAMLCGEPRDVDLLRVRTADGQSRLYAGGGGIGLDAEAVRYASGRYRHLPGRFRYIAAALHALARYIPLDVRVDFPESDMPPFEARALLAAVLNSPTYGAGVRLAPGAAVDDGSLHVILIEELSKLGALTLLPRLMGSGGLRTPRVKRWRAKRVKLTTNRPCFFHGDGEILGPTPVEIEVVPKGARVLAPALR